MHTFAKVTSNPAVFLSCALFVKRLHYKYVVVVMMLESKVEG